MRQYRNAFDDNDDEGVLVMYGDGNAVDYRVNYRDDDDNVMVR